MSGSILFGTGGTGDHFIPSVRIIILKRIIRIFFLISFLAFVYVLFSFSFTDRENENWITVSIPDRDDDRAYFEKVGNRLIVVIAWSKKLRDELFRDESKSISPDQSYYVAYAYGTNLGCPLEEEEGFRLKETCSYARYDFAGRPVPANQDFTALKVPVYTFCPDKSCINIKLN